MTETVRLRAMDRQAKRRQLQERLAKPRLFFARCHQFRSSREVTQIGRMPFNLPITYIPLLNLQPNCAIEHVRGDPNVAEDRDGRKVRMTHRQPTGKVRDTGKFVPILTVRRT